MPNINKSKGSVNKKENTILYVKEKEYLKHRYKYDNDTQNVIVIICYDGTRLDRQLYKTFEKSTQTYHLPNDTYIKNIIKNKMFKPKNILSDYDIYCCNHCDMRHLLLYWDKDLIQKNDDSYIVLKKYPHCFVFHEGIYNTQTNQLAPPFVALQKYIGLTRSQTYHLCDYFLKKVEKSAIRG